MWSRTVGTELIRWFYLVVKVFILKLLPVDALSTGAIVVGEVSSLDHEFLDDWQKQILQSNYISRSTRFYFSSALFFLNLLVLHFKKGLFTLLSEKIEAFSFIMLATCLWCRFLGNTSFINVFSKEAQDQRSYPFCKWLSALDVLSATSTQVLVHVC